MVRSQCTLTFYYLICVLTFVENADKGLKKKEDAAFQKTTADFFFVKLYQTRPILYFPCLKLVHMCVDMCVDVLAPVVCMFVVLFQRPVSSSLALHIYLAFLIF